MNTFQILPDKKAHLMREQGKTYTDTLQFIKQFLDHNEEELDDYIITVLSKEAEGMYVVGEDGYLHWQTPFPLENQHIEVVVRDRETLQFIPNLTVVVGLLDSDGNFVGEKEQPFIWHPYLYHYGSNWMIPQEEDYYAEVRINKPTFARHDEQLGARYKMDVMVKIGPIHMVPGRKKHWPE